LEAAVSAVEVREAVFKVCPLCHPEPSEASDNIHYMHADSPDKSPQNDTIQTKILKIK
jgi:hypothetical protein